MEATSNSLRAETQRISNVRRHGSDLGFYKNIAASLQWFVQPRLEPNTPALIYITSAHVATQLHSHPRKLGFFLARRGVAHIRIAVSAGRSAHTRLDRGSFRARHYRLGFVLSVRNARRADCLCGCLRRGLWIVPHRLGRYLGRVFLPL